MTFWILITIGTALVVGYIWLASARQLRAGLAGSQSAADLYEARLAEIENDVAEGQLNSAAAKDAKAEEGRRLLSVDNAKAAPATVRPSGSWIAAFLALVPVISISVYMYLGNPNAFSPSANRANVQAGGQNSIEELVAIAEQRLATHPDDAQGWKVLAPIYIRMGRFADAKTAYREIIRIEGANPGNMLALAETMVRGNEGGVSQEAKSTFEAVLKLDADNPTASFMLGVYQLQQNNPKDALKRWQAMVDGAQGNEEWLPAVQQRIETVSASLEGPSGDAAEAIRDLPAEDRQQAIEAMVEGLAARLEENPDDKAGWLRLVRAYVVLGEAETAKAAAERAINAHGADADFVEAVTTELERTNEGEDR